jgi:glycosyltransferase involved in cell wall biosynthesis
MSIKISVIVPTYNRPDLLLRCLRSLIAQKFNRDAYEIIIVSDGPDGLTEKRVTNWLKRRLHHVRYFVLPDKKGPAAARNYGWLHARGELIAFTDDDCVPDKNWLKAFYAKYTQGKEVAFTGKTIVPVAKRPTDYELNIAGLQNADFITANCCVNKKVLERTGGFDEQFTMAWREDSDLEFKLLNENIKIEKIEAAIVVHPVREAMWGVSIKEQKKTMFNALLYKKYPALYRQKIQAKPQLNYYLIILGFIIMITGFISKVPLLSIAGSILWVGLTLLFIIKRLLPTSLSVNHVFEMIVTSLIIPFLSIYWQFYGAIKYRVLFI